MKTFSAIALVLGMGLSFSAVSSAETFTGSKSDAPGNDKGMLGQKMAVRWDEAKLGALPRNSQLAFQGGKAVPLKKIKKDQASCVLRRRDGTADPQLLERVASDAGKEVYGREFTIENISASRGGKAKQPSVHATDDGKATQHEISSTGYFTQLELELKQQGAGFYCIWPGTTQDPWRITPADVVAVTGDEFVSFINPRN